jgi:hypothetical protein
MTFRQERKSQEGSAVAQYSRLSSEIFGVHFLRDL